MPMTGPELRAFAGDVLAGLGIFPSSAVIEFMTEWAAFEGTEARFNPYATTMDGGEDPADPFFNDITLDSGAVIHVKNYGSFAEGVSATARTLQLSFYPTIRMVLGAGATPAIIDANLDALAREIRGSWGTVGFAAHLEEGWRPGGAAPAPPPVPEPEPVPATLIFDRTPVDVAPNGGFGDVYPGGRVHMGVDFPVVTGTPVVNGAEGVSVPFTNDGSFGQAVCLDHGTTPWRYTLYAHLSRIDVAIGEVVARGQQVGLSGNTGASSGPHLHWQLCKTSSFPRDLAQNANPLDFVVESPEEAEVTVTQMENLALALYAGSEQMAARPDRASRVTYALDRVARVARGEEPSLIEVAASGLVLPRAPEADALAARLLQLSKEA